MQTFAQITSILQVVELGSTSLQHCMMIVRINVSREVKFNF